MHSVRKRITSAAVAAAAVLAVGGITVQAQASPGGALDQGEAHRTVWTSDRSGEVQVNWEWAGNGKGSYDGHYWGKFYDHKMDGKYVVLQAKWEGRGWFTVQSAQNGEGFNSRFHDIKGLNFRACLQGGGKCGAAAW
ncbi:MULTISPECIES: hypothetical protein [Streptomyces]|uniref:hypothetical protein n=1 Tax=Streptomyces TaxID=1883 RepID=UPI00163BA39C|nr:MULTISPECIES: hypothetical protein [Streptomyces]MBC2876609.1 hypothetical protein [Streptomyces sp. TYQ1024]UBI40721.1 hypothetical protein K7I03_32500 [Streptomyces mobaraensis]UKW33302.1 hypothetical protein MCU78_32425 [Streptomyces sp. TYQ1024]